MTGPWSYTHPSVEAGRQAHRWGVEGAGMGYQLTLAVRNRLSLALSPVMPLPLLTD